jgi:hypothetical protein
MQRGPGAISAAFKQAWRADEPTKKNRLEGRLLGDAVGGADRMTPGRIT